jgi:AraC family transcriptional regulator
MSPRRLTAGQFYGVHEVRRQHAGFGFASLAATAREEDVEEHVHETAHFVLVLSGAYITSAQGAPELACAPTLVFNPAGTRHRDRFLGGVGRFLAITLDGAASSADQARRLDGPATRLADPWSVAAARRVEHALRRPQSSPLTLEGAALQLLADPSPGEPHGIPPAWLGTAQEMIREQGGAGVSVGEVAAYVGVHPVHLARVFRDWLGCAPGEYLRGRRLERAASLVGRTALGLAEIAAETGFVDQAHLSRAFKGAFGTPPGAYRRARDVSSVQDRASAAG